MSFVLCHCCYSWVDSPDGQCPQCWQPVDPSIPDPPLEKLEAVIGELMLRVGEVRTRRKKLPDRGLLYATSNGLFFVPHELMYRLHVNHESTGASILWSLAGLVWSPLALVLMLVRTSRPKTTHVRVPLPRSLTSEDSERLAQLLMDDPGAFFIERDNIRTIERRLGGWRIERVQGSAIKLVPQPTDGKRSIVLFDEQMRSLSGVLEWSDVPIG